MLKEFNEYIKNNTLKSKSFHPFFEEALNYTLNIGGKHFRALLLLYVVKSFKPDFLQKAFDIAYAVEIMHTYSLIHDDLPCMDNSPLRRGEKSLHIKFDETTAVLVGDALNTHSFNLIANSNLNDNTKINLVKELSFGAGINGMVLGQAIDCYFENHKLNLKDLEFLHIHKTGILIATSLKMGGIVCELKQKICDKLYDLGLKIGLAFQINDDIIDVTKTQKEAGKTTQNDTNKNSFVNLLGLEEAKNKKNILIKDFEQNLKEFENKEFEKLIKNLVDKYLKD